MIVELCRIFKLSRDRSAGSFPLLGPGPCFVPCRACPLLANFDCTKHTATGATEFNFYHAK